MMTIGKKIMSIPTPVAGLALGIASLGWILDTMFSFSGVLQQVAAFLAVLLLLPVFSKFILKPSYLAGDLTHPVIGSVMPTFAMCVMVVSKAIAYSSPRTAEYTWFVGVALHVALLMGFAYFRFQQNDWHLMLPSWFVPFVGITTSAITAPSLAAENIARFLLFFGFVSFALLLPLIIRRLVAFPILLPESAKPTLAILAAPASLLLAGYLSLSKEPSLLVCGIFLGVALLLTAFVYSFLFSLIKLPFTPSFAAMTFPLVIGATALNKVAVFCEQAEIGGVFLGWLALAEVTVASLVVGYVIICFLCYSLRGTVLANIICSWLGGTKYDTCIFCTTKPF